jgi:coenzyme F420-0:L-glutamate ligase/coenzyme F420-1:gamma-L-glutamate ligase
MTEGLEILPVVGMGDIAPGADLAAAITEAAGWLRNGDILVVTSKIISKAEGRLVDVPVEGPEREAARHEILVTETARPVARRGRTRIVQTHHGFVMASAGIDASNVDRSRLVLLPKDPDASARALRSDLRERFGLDVAVIVSDTMGRPWRNGLTDVALGAAGIAPTRDHRGETDPYGNQLHITQMAIIDELSAAAELVKGKCDQVPVAVVRGYRSPDAPVPAEDGPGAVALVRESSADLFSLGTAEARSAGLAEAAALAEVEDFAAGVVERSTVDRAVARVALSPTTAIAIQPVTETAMLVPPGASFLISLATEDRSDPRQLVATGMDVVKLRASLAAEGLATILFHLGLARENPPELVRIAGPGPQLQNLAIGLPRAGTPERATDVSPR